MADNPRVSALRIALSNLVRVVEYIDQHKAPELQHALAGRTARELPTRLRRLADRLEVLQR